MAAKGENIVARPIFSQILSWITKPAESGTVKFWLLGLVLIVLVSFLWSTTVAEIKG